MGAVSGKRHLNLLKQTIITHAKSVALGISLVVNLNALALAETQKTARAQDLNYGGVLYEYYQGNAFEALSLLNVAKEKGGIKGHGDHPDLVEGGLLLSYGMTQEAKAIFESLLKDKLSISDQNLAWFYLGKVFYLEQNYPESLDSFDQINVNVLITKDQEKYYELIYIKSQIEALTSVGESKAYALANASIDALPPKHIYRYYIHYNHAVSLLDGSNNEAAISALQKLSNALLLERRVRQRAKQRSENVEDQVDLVMELKALCNQSLLSLGQLYLQNNQNALAFDTLKQVDRDSVFAEQALFAYAISASNLERHDLALSALNTLNAQTLFNPWQQQTPYALAYLYEQLKEPILSLEAYRAAVGKYEALQETLVQEQQALSEDVLLQALNITSSLGTEAIEKDAYGRIRIPKQSFSFAKLLTSEAFQRQLSELHELYLIKNSMHRWEKQLDSFKDMLATRLLSRQQKLKSTQAELALKEVDLWTDKQQQFKTRIETAIDNDNVYFFMTEEQIAYFNRLQKVQERLATLPDDHAKKAAYQTRFARAKAYFDWWVADDYSINAWHTQKQLRALQAEMRVFRKQYQLLDAEQDLDAAHLEFAERVNAGKERLDSLSASLEESLETSGNHLISQVDAAMNQQLEEIGRYLLASREALARVSDSLLVDGKISYHNSAVENVEDEQ